MTLPIEIEHLRESPCLGHSILVKAIIDGKSFPLFYANDEQAIHHSVKGFEELATLSELAKDIVAQTLRELSEYKIIIFVQSQPVPPLNSLPTYTTPLYYGGRFYHGIVSLYTECTLETLQNQLIKQCCHDDLCHLGLQFDIFQ